jgi:hypothetical protein
MQLQQLLPHRLAGDGELRGELGDRGGAALLERDQDRAAAFGKLIDGEDGVSPFGPRRG